MFRSGIFSRIFRLRSRRPTKENASSESAEVAQRPSSGPPPPKSRRPVSSQPEPIDASSPPSTSQPRPVFTHSPGETPTQDSPTSIIVIGQDPAQSSLAPPPFPAVSGNVGPQIYLDGVLLLESPPAQTDISTRHVSFHFPTARMQGSPESPLSPCSTLVSHDVEIGIGLPGPMELPVTPEATDSASGWVVSAESDAEMNDVVRSVPVSGRARPKSHFNPQPVRADMSRFSVSATRATMPRTNARDGRRESKRASAMPVGSFPGLDRREKRKSRWSREMSKPETQEVMRALSGI